MAGYGKIPRPSGKPKTPSIYPYPQASEVAGRDKDKKKGKDAATPKGPIFSPHGLGRDKTKKNISREWNRGPVKGGK